MGPDSRTVFYQKGNSTDGFELFATTIPEPTSVVFVVLGCLGFVTTRRQFGRVHQ